MVVRRLTHLALLFCVLTVCLSASPAAASASDLSARNPLQLAGGHGLPAAPASASAAAQALRQQAGVDPSQVTVQNSCAAATPGHAACDAQVLVLKSTHRPVHPHALGRVTRAQLALAGVPAPATEPTGQAPPSQYTPQFLQQAYDLTYLSAQNGGNDTVAIVDAYDDPTAESDLATYRARYGLPACTTGDGCFTEVNQNGQASPLPSGDSGWETEESLDLDAVSALCPNCHILLVEANSNGWSDMQAAAQTAASLGANQISMSFSGDLSGDPGVGPWTFSGVSSLAATGDHGYAGGTDNDCYSSPASSYCNNYPAAEPGVTAVGGTTLTASSTSRGFGESAWSLSNGWGGGSGCDTNEAKPAYQHDTGCTGRSYSDVSADANANTGIYVYDSGNGGWGLVGGTSLATPLTAAFEAVTSVDGTSPQWAYTDSAALNDVISGSNGSCVLAIGYICDAGPGYDGPTGNGSISGDVTSGAPQPAGTYAAAVEPGDATVSGGIYPNGLDTTYYWEYGTSTSYGQQTAAVDIGSGAALAPVQTPLTNLTPQTTYHYRLVATNSVATTYGYDHTFTTPANLPVDLTAPTVSGTLTQGQTLTAQPGLWSPTGTISYQWQRYGYYWQGIPGATAATYTLTASDAQTEVRVMVTESSSGGSTQAFSDATGTISPLTAPPNPVAPSIPAAVPAAPSISPAPGDVTGSGSASVPSVSGHAAVGSEVKVSIAAGSGTVRSVRFFRCAQRCVPVSAPGANGYRLGAADQGYYIRAQVSLSTGATVWTTQMIGPVSSPTAGAATVPRAIGHVTVVRALGGRALAVVHIAKLTARTLTLNVAAQGQGPVAVWACLVRRGAPASCTPARMVHGHLALTVPLVKGDSVQLVALRRR